MMLRTVAAVRPVGRWMTWIAIGAASAAVPTLAAGVGIDTRYVVYGIVALTMAAVIPYVRMLAGSAERLLWVVFVLSLQLELAFTPITYGGVKPAGPFGTMITPTLLGALALIAVWSSARIWGGGNRLRVSRPLVFAAMAMTFTALLSIGNAAGRVLSLFGIFELLSLGAVAVAASHACADARNLRTLYVALFAILLIQSSLIVIEQVIGVQISLAKGINTDYGWGNSVEGRFAGTFGAPSTAATFLVVCLLFLFRRMTSERTPRQSLRLWGLFALGFLALLLTRTRSGWIGLAIGGIGMGWQCYREGTLSRRLARRLLAGGLLALLVAWPLVSERLEEDHKGMADTRGNLAWIAVEMIKANPIIGVGINTATNQVYSYAVRAGLANGWVFIVHNQFLLVGAETGLPGLAAFVALIGIGVAAARRCMQSSDMAIKETGCALFWSLIAMIWALNLDHVSGCMTYVLLWFLIGAACGLDALSRKQASGGNHVVCMPATLVPA
jgi:O-antigen ligase